MVTNNFALTLYQGGKGYQDTEIIVVKNDANVNNLIMRIYNGTTEITYTQVSSGTITFLREDGNTVQGELTINASNITYTMGTTENDVVGTVKTSVQLFGASGERLTPARFKFAVEEDLTDLEVVASTTNLLIATNLASHLGNTATAHGAVSTATANKILVRDSDGRAKVAAPSAEDDIALKSTVTDLAGAGRTTETVKGNTDAIASHLESDYHSISLKRQAIINGNFDIWQRGTSFTNPASTAYTADRWLVAYANNGVLPNITVSRNVVTAGSLPNSFYRLDIAVDGAGSGFGANDVYVVRQKIEHGTRFLAGAGKKVTVKFNVSGNIVGKKIGVKLAQAYGTGGTPTASETINGTHFTVYAGLTEYTHTFTLNTLSGKTFGTNNDDYLELSFGIMWGTTRSAEFGDTVAETFVGAGNIDIAQVQLCAGDVALPLQPKSFEEELRVCQRYYEKSFDYVTAPANVNTDSQQTVAMAYSVSDTTIPKIKFRSLKRTTPTITLYSDGGGSGVWDYYTPGTWNAFTSSTPTSVRADGFRVDSSKASAFTMYSSYMVRGHWTADSEL